MKKLMTPCVSVSPRAGSIQAGGLLISLSEWLEPTISFSRLFVSRMVMTIQLKAAGPIA